MTRASLCLLAAIGLLPLGTSPLQGQRPGEGCRFLPGSGDAQQRTFPDGIIVTARRANISCDDGRRIRADSLTYNQASGYAEFFGNVRFEDADRTLEADQATYTEGDRRLRATGSIVVTDRRDNSTIRDGEVLTYLRAGGGRAVDEMTVLGGRPRATLNPAAGDSIAGPDAPWDVTGNRIFLRGESYFEAQGNVQMTRDSIRTQSDSLIYDEVSGTLNLNGRARMEQGETVMNGRRIRARIPKNEIEELTAFGEGSLTAEDLDLEAPWIRVTFIAGELDALYAAPLARQALAESEAETPAGTAQRPSERELLADPVVVEAEQPLRDSLDALQPKAVAEGTTITGDSLEVLAPGQRAERVIAVGRAYAISAARDSINTLRTPEFARRDWIRGDTIVATFSESEAEMETDAAGRPSSSGKLVIEQLVASGTASSMYRIPPDSSTSGDTTPAGDPTAGTTASADSSAVATDPEPLDAPREAATEEIVFSPLPGNEPAIHYVSALQITLNFIAGEIDTMVVLGLEEGIHLAPGKVGGGSTGGDVVTSAHSVGAAPEGQGNR